MQEHCPTIGVLGVPIDKTYPATNRELRRQIEANGCVISEYPPESMAIGRVGFLQRNRLIAALSMALVVVEAQEKSGTMSTVAHAERYGKPVFAVPGSIYSPNSAGTNGLLREGRAKAVCKAEDLFSTLRLDAAPAQAGAAGCAERHRAEGAGVHRGQGERRGGDRPAERAAHGSFAGHPDEAGADGPRDLSAGQEVYSALTAQTLNFEGQPLYIKGELLCQNS